MTQHLCITPSEEIPRWLDLVITVLASVIVVGYWLFVAPVKWVIIKTWEAENNGKTK